MKEIARKPVWSLVFALMLVATAGLAGEEKQKSSMVNPGYRDLARTMAPNAMIATAGAVGSPAYHRHLVRPGHYTTYLVRIFNSEAARTRFRLSVTAVTEGFRSGLSEKIVTLDPGRELYVELKVLAAPELKPGTAATVKVKAEAEGGKSGEITVEAETTARHKVYYVSIDSLSPVYLELNAKGNGKGQDGDWLMPNLKSLLSGGVFFPNHQAHLVTATDMNHASYLSGAYPGRLGLYCVDVFLFGFDNKGVAQFKTTPLDLMYYGPEGKPVTNIFNVVREPAYGGNPQAFTAYVSGKDWVPEHYRNPVFGLNRIATIYDRPDYLPPAFNAAKANVVKDTLQAMTGKLKNPDLYLWEDAYTEYQAEAVVKNEDPDVMYVLMGGVDAAGHLYGAGWDLEEWDDRGTPDDLADDISRVNDHANRLGIIKTVKNADDCLGRFIAFLKEREAYDDAVIVVESDHNMETAFFAGPPITKLMKESGYSPQTDFYLFTASQIGMVFLRREDPKVLVALEKALESYRMKNPRTGVIECPLVAIDREEMKTGIDGATGEAVTLPMELYSEFYLEHQKPGRMRYPDMMLFSKKNYEFPVVGVGLANVGVPIMNIQVPPIYVQVGAHGGPSTRPALLGLHGPGIPSGLSLSDQTYPSDVAPFLYRLEGYKIPESVQGRGLPIGVPRPGP